MLLAISYLYDTNGYSIQEGTLHEKMLSNKTIKPIYRHIIACNRFFSSNCYPFSPLSNSKATRTPITPINPHLYRLQVEETWQEMDQHQTTLQASPNVEFRWDGMGNNERFSAEVNLYLLKLNFHLLRSTKIWSQHSSVNIWWILPMAFQLKAQTSLLICVQEYLKMFLLDMLLSFSGTLCFLFLAFTPPLPLAYLLSCHCDEGCASHGGNESDHTSIVVNGCLSQENPAKTCNIGDSWGWIFGKHTNCD